MKVLSKRLLIIWALNAIALVLSCIANSWLFFLGLALLIISGLFSAKEKKRRHWPWNLFSWLVAIAAVVFLARVTSYGRHPLEWPFAALLWVVFVAEDLNWGAPRKTDGA